MCIPDNAFAARAYPPYTGDPRDFPRVHAYLSMKHLGRMPSPPKDANLDRAGLMEAFAISGRDFATYLNRFYEGNEPPLALKLAVGAVFGLAFGAGIAGGAASATAGEVAVEAGAGATAAGEAGATAAVAGSSTVAAITENIDDALEAADTVLDATGGTVLESVLGFVKDVRDTLAPILNTISGAVRSIRDVVVAINDGIIKPVVTPILETVKIIKGLTDAIERYQKEGIIGILKIPQAITDSFLALDATMQRAVQMFGAQYLDALETRLIPGLAHSGAVPIGELNSIVKLALPGAMGPWVAPPEVKLGEPPSLAAFKAYAREQQEQLNADTSLPALIFHWLFRLTGTLSGLTAQNEPYAELWRREVQREAAIKLFEPGAALDLHGKNILSRDDAFNELREAGYSEERANALIESIRKIPADSQAVDWFYRGLIDEAGLRSILEVNNWSPEDQQRVIDASRKLLGAGDAIVAWHHAFISEADLDKLLAAQGYDFEQAAALKAISFTPRNVPAIIRQLARTAIMTDPLLMLAAERVPPEDVMRAGRESGLSSEAIGSEWTNHWQILSPADAVEAYFRGWFSEEQIGHYLDAWHIPRQVQRNFIDLQRPRIPYRTTAVLIAQGLISEVEGMDILRSHGFTLADAALLVQIERKATGPASSADADAFAGLTQSTVLQLYDAGTITREDATRLLAEVGMGAEAAESVLMLADVKEAAQQRAADVDLIVALATSGGISIDEASAELSGLGATAQEQAKALAKITRGVKTGIKLPSEDKLLQMWRKGLLTREAANDALSVLGYNAGWRQLLLELEGTRGAGPE